MAGMIIEIPWGDEKRVYTDTFGDREHFLGQWGMTPDGRLFRWAFSGGVIGAGERVESAPATAADDQDLAVQAAAAVGDTTVSVTTAGAITVNLYQDGYMFVNDVDGEGHLYAIRSHPVVATGSNTTVFTLHEPIREALTTSSQVGLVKNLYKDVIIGAAASTAGATVGVAPTEVTDNDYFWCQVSGIAAVLAEDSAMVVGSGIEKGVDVAGAFQLHDTSVNLDERNLGEAMNIVAAAGDSSVVILNIL